MKTFVAAVTALLASAAASSENRTLVGLSDIDPNSIACGCFFNEALAVATEASNGSGPLLFVIAPNAEPPHALVNLGVGNVTLSPTKPIEFPMYQCEVGEQFDSEWISRNLVIRATLNVVSPGDEACWFTGVIGVPSDLNQAPIAIKGACGC